MAEITMPRLSDTMEEGTVARWLKQPGDAVQRGDILAEIETDKATMELEAFAPGTLQEILVGEGQAVPIGAVIALLGETAGMPAAAPPAASSSSGNGAAHTPAAATGAETSDAPRVRASPLARRVADDHGIDLRRVAGTGPGGRIIRENVEAFVQQHDAAPPAEQSAPASQPQPAAATPEPDAAAPDDVQPLSRMRRAIAQRMTEAKHGTPHFYVTSEIDVGELLRLRHQLNDSGGDHGKISVNDFLIKAAAKALEAYPALNSSFVEAGSGGATTPAGVRHHAHINISVAIAVDDGLIVPVVADADRKSLGTIAAEVKDLAARARDSSIRQHELEGGTFTISNMGMFDVTSFAAIITPPQAAVLAISAIRRMPLVRHHDEIEISDVMSVTLSVDHRVTDGATAARFVHKLKRLLEAPMNLLV